MKHSMVGVGAIRGVVGACRFVILDLGAGASSEGAKTAGIAFFYPEPV
jgi:hypothetical protein